MQETHVVTHDKRGRVQIPADVRRRAGITPDSRLLLLEDHGHLELITTERLLEEFRNSAPPHGSSIIDELLEERRKEAARDNAEYVEWLHEVTQHPDRLSVNPKRLLEQARQMIGVVGVDPGLLHEVIERLEKLVGPDNKPIEAVTR